MGKGYKAGRLGEEIRKILSQLLISGLKDPRLSSGLVSVSEVEVTNDGSYATCYITVLTTSNEDEELIKAQVIEGLNSAKGLIKKEIAKAVKIRHIPELIFKIDGSMEYGRKITEVLKGLDIKDEDSDADSEQ